RMATARSGSALGATSSSRAVRAANWRGSPRPAGAAVRWLMASGDRLRGRHATATAALHRAGSGTLSGVRRRHTGGSMQRYALLAAPERLPARPFTDPERTRADARVMDRMLERLRREARSWPSWRTSVELLKHTRAGCRHWLVVPSAPALGGARDVT